jgi:hypothetical protein
MGSRTSTLAGTPLAQLAQIQNALARATLMERTGIEPVTSGLQIPDFKPRLGQIRLVKAKLRWLGEVEIGYSGTRFGTLLVTLAGASRIRKQRFSNGRWPLDHERGA